ncbi:MULTISPECIES: mechanosensitive ion channel family protein [Providencia]|uniref:mechanosensitive ion channel family protein n=1 Tax=Providencia TaxID=586 RepID=UPI00197DFFBC|nr:MULTISPECIES: mechanosensitive ion channel family protein [Providencia]HEC8329107.1 mechanosensitive ion channel family protein [Providencia rettgeri]MBN4866866.1 mechanosensitive ion channel family protein [Providencia stuartii]MBN4876230.1 mechanosensitive ion channel family protein [Providencia stuartii]MBN4880880.1 mechanosensitive ion channel family protein [Providencia stuartii]MBN4885388.1 mechanosensitive ion channel family protein [Providencia stuartii]
MIEVLLEKYAIGMTIIAACLMLYVFFEIFHKRRKHKHKHKSIIIHVIQTVVLCSVVVVAAQYVDMAAADFDLNFISTPLVNFITIALIALILMRKLFQLANRLEKTQIKKGSDPTSARIVARVFKTTVFVVMVLLFGEHFGMSLSGLMAFGGIGGIAIGMAGKDILSNFFSGLMLYFDRPFNIGDWVSSPDRNIEGTVVEIGWRITKIITFDHRPLYIPNSVFSSISVENPGRMTNRRIKTELGLRYEDSDKIGAIVDDIRTMLQQDENIDTSQTLLVYFDAFADSSLNIMVYCFTKTTVWAEWLAAQQDVYLKIIEIVKRHGADFAFPSQTLYVEKNH